MTPLPPLYILRHGETAWNAQGRLQGRLDSPLTDRGRAQAAAQGRILARLGLASAEARISPSGRTLATATIALPANMPRQLDPRLMEVDIGRWAGRTEAEIEAAHPNFVQDYDAHSWKFHAPGGETLADMTARCAAVLGAVFGPTILVTHGVTSRVLRCLALGMPPEALAELPGGQGVVHVIIEGRAWIEAA